MRLGITIPFVSWSVDTPRIPTRLRPQTRNTDSSDNFDFGGNKDGATVDRFSSFYEGKIRISEKLGYLKLLKLDRLLVV